ncbi:hypothetical protein JHK85_037472 [Glycine max]|nr:hypothetical protein JHK85_037472 [Glycine max]
MITKATADGTFNTRNKDMEQHATTKSYCKHRKLKSLQLLIDNVKEKGLEDEVARLEKHKRDGNIFEYQHIDEIVKEVSRHVLCPIGLDEKIFKVNLLLSSGSDGVRMIGICGEAGIGKITLAHEVFHFNADKEYGNQETQFVSNDGSGDWDPMELD